MGQTTKKAPRFPAAPYLVCLFGGGLRTRAELAILLVADKAELRHARALDDLQHLVWEDEDEDWAEKDSIRLVSRAELGDVMAEQDVLFNF